MGLIETRHSVRPEHLSRADSASGRDGIDIYSAMIDPEIERKIYRKKLHKNHIGSHNHDKFTVSCP